jgi:hypothetical protein
MSGFMLNNSTSVGPSQGSDQDMIVGIILIICLLSCVLPTLVYIKVQRCKKEREDPDGPLLPRREPRNHAKSTDQAIRQAAAASFYRDGLIFYKIGVRLGQAGHVAKSVSNIRQALRGFNLAKDHDSAHADAHIFALKCSMLLMQWQLMDSTAAAKEKMTIANQLYSQGDQVGCGRARTEALRLFKKIFDMNSASHEACYGICNCQFLLGYYEKALASVDSAIAQFPSQSKFTALKLNIMDEIKQGPPLAPPVASSADSEGSAIGDVAPSGSLSSSGSTFLVSHSGSVRSRGDEETNEAGPAGSMAPSGEV